nr:hypothetical protein [Chloroflexia bacterium]
VELANVHVMATTPNFLFLEHMPHDIARRHTVVEGAAKVVDGHIPLPKAPGLGIELNLEEIARYGLLPVADYTHTHRTPGEIRRWHG